MDDSPKSESTALFMLIAQPRLIDLFSEVKTEELFRLMPFIVSLVRLKMM